MTTLAFWQLAADDPDRVAVIDPDGTEHTAGQLLGASNQLVHGLRGLGLTHGDVVAVMLPNSAVFCEVLMAVAQAGWQLVPINHHLRGPEIGYILTDSQARVFITHERFAEEAGRAQEQAMLPPDACLAVGDVPGLGRYSSIKEGRPGTAPTDRRAGGLMNYTSGTTGRPKGVQRPLPDGDPDEVAERGTFLHLLFGIEPMADNVHLTVAPLYHTAVVQFTSLALHCGHRVVLMDEWTPEGTLERIARHRVTTTHMVPTMFHRLLQLPDDVRAAADVSSLRHVVHSAAPCPILTKQAMVDWWGPVLWEYYAATEGGGTIASPSDWLRKPGTVGCAWPTSHLKIADDEGNDLPAGAVGMVWMKMDGRTFTYHDDPEKTRRTIDEQGFFTAGDIGELDADGFLFLHDRRVDLIISGGVNIYPAETEAALLQHPAVGDCAVLGVPNPDLGAEVKAVVVVREGCTPTPELAAELIEFCTRTIAAYKAPRSVDFREALPRDPSGKLFKHRLREAYRPSSSPHRPV